MASFAERMGYRQARTLIQKDDIDEETRVALWNDLVILREIFDELINKARSSDETEIRLLQSVWTGYYKKPFDEKPRNYQIWSIIKNTIIKQEWYDSFSIIEFIVQRFALHASYKFQDVHVSLVSALNSTFEKHLVGYRFIDKIITPIDSEAEVNAVEDALAAVDHLAGARHSLDRAIELLADRKLPDYPNSIKESISAVEAVVKKVTGKGTLGDGLKRLEAAGLTIHPVLKAAWLKMYGWTSDANGVRHAGIEAADANQALAKYALVTCSAFISYLLDEGQKNGLLAPEN